MTSISALDCPVHFLREQQTKLYKMYGPVVAQLEKVLYARTHCKGGLCPAWKGLLSRLDG